MIQGRHSHAFHTLPPTVSCTIPAGCPVVSCIPRAANRQRTKGKNILAQYSHRDRQMLATYQSRRCVVTTGSTTVWIRKYNRMDPEVQPYGSGSTTVWIQKYNRMDPEVQPYGSGSTTVWIQKYVVPSTHACSPYQPLPILTMGNEF